MLLRNSTQNEQASPLRHAARLCIPAILLLMALFLNACSRVSPETSPAETLLFGQSGADTMVSEPALTKAETNSETRQEAPKADFTDSTLTALPDSLAIPAETVLLTFVQYSY